MNIIVAPPDECLTEAAEYLATSLNASLREGNRVLWLVSGGSSIHVAAQASRKLDDGCRTRLVVMLTDERYGPVGHADSNAQQLIEAGFHLGKANVLPVLQEGLSVAATLNAYAEDFVRERARADMRIGLFGVGPDGHTAGILPGSPAVHADREVTEYQTPTYHRLTLTPSGITKLDEAVIYAVGKQKWPTVIDFIQTKEPPEVQPAQILKSVSRWTLFTDAKNV